MCIDHEATRPLLSLGTLDPSELRCCNQQMQPEHNMAFVCPTCRWGVTHIEFLRAAHMPNVRQAVAQKELGRQF